MAFFGKCLRFLGWSFGGLMGLILLGLFGLWLFAMASLPNGWIQGWRSDFGLTGMESPVRIIRDAKGIPHIFAETLSDGHRALGFVHAQDRLFQMEMMRRLGAGRLGEVLGKVALSSDRFHRVLGLYALAEAQVDRLNPETRLALEAYAEGVNAWRDQAWLLPPEFAALGLSPEPWQPADSLVWAKIMSIRLSGNAFGEMLRAELSDRLGRDQIDALFRTEPPGVSLGQRTGGTGSVVSALSAWQGIDWQALLDGLPAPPPDRAIGASNAWAVTGARTETRAPLLANDPHLGFSAPILWYLARIETPKTTLVGATVPGVPFTIIGRNRSLAWGLTTTQADLQDLFIEREGPEPGTYLTPGGPRPFALREEVIRLKDADPVTLKIRSTRHGPVISDHLDRAEEIAGGAGRMVSLQATFLRGGDLTPQALLGLNLAKTLDQAAAALTDFHAPVQNVTVADKAGSIGLFIAGKVPKREGGDGWYPSRGWTDEGRWRGFVPFREMPHQIRPERGFVANANEAVIAPGMLPFISRDWAPGYRAERLEARLQSEPRQSLQSSLDLQLDTTSLAFQRLMPLMGQFEPTSDEADKALGLLKSWSGEMAARRAEPLLFWSWVLNFERRLYQDELGEHWARALRLRPRFLEQVLTGAQGWCDDVTTPATVEVCSDLLAESFDQALKEGKAAHGDGFLDWQWGEVHQARFGHAILSRIPWGRLGLDRLPVVGPQLARLLGDFASPRIATDGGAYTLHRGGFRISSAENPFGHVHGAGLRAVMDLNSPERSRFRIATGQSGHPFSSHYDDQVDDWAAGRSLVISGTERQLLEDGGRLLTLNPVQAPTVTSAP
ncbi:MAG: penicillin acylase family protein [Magnetovibrionaceae bacterium]